MTDVVPHRATNVVGVLVVAIGSRLTDGIARFGCFPRGTHDVLAVPAHSRLA